MGSGQKIIILLGVAQDGANPGQRIGSPVDISEVGVSGGSVLAAAAA